MVAKRGPYNAQKSKFPNISKFSKSKNLKFAKEKKKTNKNKQIKENNKSHKKMIISKIFEKVEKAPKKFSVSLQ